VSRPSKILKSALLQHDAFMALSREISIPVGFSGEFPVTQFRFIESG
jgi:hypothetical protein